MIRISVCMATYNGEKYIKDQINSILEQLEDNDELIISDDGSNDRTLQYIREIGDSRINVLEHESDGYYTSNFENALIHAKGMYIFLADQDDVWEPNKVRICLEYLKDYDFIMSDAYIVDQDLNILCESRNHKYQVKNGFVPNFIKSRYLGCCFAFKKKVLDLALPFPKNHDLCHHDSWISLVAELNYKCCIVNKPLILYRRHDTNTSTGGATSSSLWKILRIRKYLLINLLKRKCQKR